MRLVCLWLALSACGADVPGPEVLIPVDGAVVGRRALLPVVVAIGARDPADISVEVDGEAQTLLLPIARNRVQFTGGGTDYIATMDFSNLEPGDHELQVRDGNGVSRVRLVVPERHRVDFEVLDDSGQPTAGRVYVFQDGVPVDLSSGFGMDHQQRDIDVLAADCPVGRCAVFLEDGDYEFVGWRGLRGGLHRVSRTIDGAASLSLTVPLEVPTPGEVASDLHVHSGLSGDSWIPLWLRYESLAAAGIDRFVLTDHANTRDPAVLLSDAGILPGFGIPGVEADLRVLRDDRSMAAGHFIAFPLASDVDELLPPVRTQDIALSWSDYRTAPIAGATDVVLQLNHPRGIQFRPELEPQPQWELFDRLGFSHDDAFGVGENAWMGLPDQTGRPPGLDFDVLEVVNRFSMELYFQVRADWFELLDRGLFVAGTGNSDSHGLSVELAGMTATLVRSPFEDVAVWAEAIRAGKARVTSGVFVDLSVDTSLPGDVRVGGDGQARVRVQAPSWVPAEQVRLVQDGMVVWSAPLDASQRDENGVLDVSFDVPLTVAADGWVLAEAGFAVDQIPDASALGFYGQIAPGYVPLGFTNPVRLDVTGDGWSP